MKKLLGVSQGGNIQGPAGCVAAEGQRKVEIGEKIQNHIAHALLAGKRESPSIEPSKQDGPRTQSECFENISPASNASVK